MPDLCTLYITNVTDQDLNTTSSNKPYQMTTWQFPNIPAGATVGVDVQFYTGSYDEDDGAEQNYTFGTGSVSNVIDVYATSDDHSGHWLSVRSLGGSAPTYCVVAICGSGTIPAADVGAIGWHPITGVQTAAPQSHQAPPFKIGEITSDGMAMSFAMVDLSKLFQSDEAQTYFNAIKHGNLTDAQATTLGDTLKAEMAFGGESSTWMTANWNMLSDKALSSICMPGTHDAGMGTITYSTAGSDACNTQTQKYRVLDQLNQGARYLDLRPCTWDNYQTGKSGLYLCHYSNVPVLGVFGSAGQLLTSALNDVATFMAQSAGSHELVILKFSHFGSLFLPPPPPPPPGGGVSPPSIWTYSPMSSSTFTTLVKDVTNILGAWLVTDTNSKVNLNQQAMTNLSGSGNRVLAVFDLGMQKSGDFPAAKVDTGAGIFGYQDYMTNPPSGTTPNMVVFDQYANSDDLNTMISDQKSKFINYTTNPKQSFLLSWTLTMQLGDQISGSPCISELADQADGALSGQMGNWMSDNVITSTKKPNILLIDYIGAYSDNAVGTAMAINAWPQTAPE